MFLDFYSLLFVFLDVNKISISFITSSDPFEPHMWFLCIEHLPFHVPILSYMLLHYLEVHLTSSSPYFLQISLSYLSSLVVYVCV